ncbi:aldehyde dehydrogenase family protein [Echinimonas agarilytica]|uniref:Aldehyde dehydrogenase family protein n=1 Tax=Echinimonas agarilytica TaxID=1215918 RepID=A0AA41W781_9GAMM|nr:aldehyde dehydrogenase family protein [Echinimonas agarilytica]MCM2679708.1 aldehyde dehydrogenase family protein [Echinimonas agarilytica]
MNNSTVTHYPCYIDGAWHESLSQKTFEVENPSNAQIWATIPDCNKDDVELAMASSQQAFMSWSKLPAIERGRWLFKLIEGLKPKRDHFAQLIVQEQGKTLPQAYGEFDDTLNYLQYSAEAARRIEGNIYPSENPKEQLWIQKVPYGVTLGLCAYNYPLALIGRKVGPALVTGNTIILKAHEATPVTASEFCKVVDEIGFPKGVINLVSGSGIEVSSALVTHPETRLVSLTGSTRAGQAIYKSSSENVSGLILELGGKASFIVLADADLDKAAEAAVTSRYANCGQVCICNELVLVEESVAEAFTQKVLERVKQITVGDPLSGADMGPSVTADSVERIDQLLQGTVAMGATVALGGKRPDGAEFENGNWYEPTVVTDVTADMPLAKHEIFGPIMPIIAVKDYQHALDICNDREDALSAYIYSQNINTVFNAISDMQVGTVFVNKQIVGYVQGYHSGHKRSGTGGEDGVYGIENYLQKRTIYFNYD